MRRPAANTPCEDEQIRRAPSAVIYRALQRRGKQEIFTYNSRGRPDTATNFGNAGRPPEPCMKVLQVGTVALPGQRRQYEGATVRARAAPPTPLQFLACNSRLTAAS